MMRLPYEKMIIWQKAMNLAVAAYDVSRLLPKTEMYGLSSQIQRAATSVPANIAEGSKRTTDRDFSQFLAIARGSLAELETHVLLAERIGHIDQKTVQSFMECSIELSKMLRSFHEKLFSR